MANLIESNYTISTQILAAFENIFLVKFFPKQLRLHLILEGLWSKPNGKVTMHQFRIKLNEINDSTIDLRVSYAINPRISFHNYSQCTQQNHAYNISNQNSLQALSESRIS